VVKKKRGVNEMGNKNYIKLATTCVNYIPTQKDYMHVTINGIILNPEVLKDSKLIGTFYLVPNKEECE